MIELRLEDCREGMRAGLTYDYLLGSPPDYEVLGFALDDRGRAQYRDWFSSTAELFAPRGGYVTLFTTDRKSGGRIITKHAMMTALMQRLRYRLVSQKLWIKSLGTDLFRPTYTFVLTFARAGATRKTDKSYGPDVFHVPPKRINGYRENFEPELVAPFVLSFTKQGEVVYDPFVGSGTTALVCAELGRSCVGSEIDQTTFELARDRLRVAGVAVAGG